MACLSKKSLFFVVALIFFLQGCDQDHKTTKNTEANPEPQVAMPVPEMSEIEKLKKVAEAGDSKAQLELAKRYDSGDALDQNLEKAFEWFIKSAEHGNLEAMVEVARRYSDGKGVKKDNKKSNAWWAKAAEAGNAEAQYQHAQSFGHTDRLTWITGSGDELKKNADQYVKWLSKAAEQNHSAAKYALGMTYILGAGDITTLLDESLPKTIIPAIKEKGLSLLRDSADMGYWQAEWAMAVLYQTGFGEIKADKELSEKYWKKLDDKNDSEIQVKIGSLYHQTDKEYYKVGKNKYHGLKLDFDETNRVAFDWFSKAAENNNIYAIYIIGTMYRDGIGTYIDKHKAFQYFKHGADLGDFDSIRAIAMAYYNGSGTPKDYAESYQQFPASLKPLPRKG